MSAELTNGNATETVTQSKLEQFAMAYAAAVKNNVMTVSEFRQSQGLTEEQYNMYRNQLSMHLKKAGKSLPRLKKTPRASSLTATLADLFSE